MAMAEARTAEFGIIGGSGLYEMLDNPEELDMDTEYGKPSDLISLGKISGKDVAFIPRHGRKHTITPQNIPYRANIEALNKLGVKRIIATSAVGSLNPAFIPGDFVFPDQFINMTSGRQDTYYDKDRVAHVSTSDPYCTQMAFVESKQADFANLKYHDKATVVVVNGPRFSTRAESTFFKSIGAKIINMTQYPEVTLARERGICYSCIAIITDFDAGVEEELGIKPVEYKDVSAKFKENMPKLKSFISTIIKSTPEEKKCSCGNSLENAFVNV